MSICKKNFHHVHTLGPLGPTGPVGPAAPAGPCALEEKNASHQHSQGLPPRRPQVLKCG